MRKIYLHKRFDSFNCILSFNNLFDNMVKNTNNFRIFAFTVIILDVFWGDLLWHLMDYLSIVYYKI